MKKILIVAITALAVAIGTSNSYAGGIEGPSPIGSKYLGVRFGAGPGVGANVAFDYGIVDSWWKGLFTVGGYTGATVRTYNDYDRYNIPVALRATYRLNITKEFEVYGGAMSGFYMDTYSTSSVHKDNETDVKFLGAAVAGASYYVTPSFGLVAEIVGGSGVGAFNIGLQFKF